jgi:hypothetical protein
MRKIIVTEYITLDGVFEEPGHWSFDYFNDEAMHYKDAIANIVYGCACIIERPTG